MISENYFEVNRERRDKMTITIRNMQLTDIEAVAHVATKSWHATYEGIIPQHIQHRFLEMAYSKERLKHRCEKTSMYVATENENIIGFANFSNVKKDGEVELSAIYLLPTVWGKGIGSQLLAYGIEQLSPSTIFINVEAENEVGKQFYIARNFRMVEEFEEDFEGHTLKTIRMVLTL